MKRKILWVVGLLVLAGTVPLHAGSKAWKFTLEDIDGQRISLDSLLQIGPVILDFWATWCTYCDEELDLLNDLQKEFPDRMTVVAISLDSPRTLSKIRALRDARGWQFPIVLDSRQTLKRKYRVFGLPTIFVISQDGEILLTRQGYNPAQEEDLRALIQQHLPLPSDTSGTSKPSE